MIKNRREIENLKEQCWKNTVHQQIWLDYIVPIEENDEDQDEVQKNSEHGKGNEFECNLASPVIDYIKGTIEASDSDDSSNKSLSSR